MPPRRRPSAIERYCQICELPSMTQEKFWESHTCSCIQEIDGKTIKEIVLEA